MVTAVVKTPMLSEALGAVTVLVDETKIEFRSGGLRIRTVDDANVGAVSLSLLETAFESYEGGEEDVCIDISQLKKITQKLNNDVMEISVNRNREKLMLASGGYRFELPLLDPDTVRDARDPRELNPPAEIVIRGANLKRIINVGGMFSDNIVLGVDAKEREFYAASTGENESMNVEFNENELINSNLEDAHSIYSAAYLREMSKTIPDGAEVTIETGEEYPAKISFEIAEENGRVTYSLAPRIE